MAQSFMALGFGRVTLWTQTFAEQITLPIHGFHPIFVEGRLRIHLNVAKNISKDPPHPSLSPSGRGVGVRAKGHRR